jgi:hypothetical protein
VGKGCGWHIIEAGADSDFFFEKTNTRRAKTEQCADRRRNLLEHGDVHAARRAA